LTYKEHGVADEPLKVGDRLGSRIPKRLEMKEAYRSIDDPGFPRFLGGFLGCRIEKEEAKKVIRLDSKP